MYDSDDIVTGWEGANARRVAMNAWQVLGAVWGIHQTQEQARISNWFYAIAHSRPTEGLFPLRLREDTDDRRAPAPLPETPAEIEAALNGDWPPIKDHMTETQIKHMVNRFLAWKLPETFNPDGGISFKRTFNEQTPWPMKNEPVGTNLFDATQADAMVRYMIDGLPSGAIGDPCHDQFGHNTEKCEGLDSPSHKIGHSPRKRGWMGARSESDLGD